MVPPAQTVVCESSPVGGPGRIWDRFSQSRRDSLDLAAPLSPEDQQLQSMTEASPTKWHLAHTSWVYEAFVLGPHCAGYQDFDADYNYLFNSYYKSVGPHHLRSQRGMLSRPSLARILDYRAHVNAAMEKYLKGWDDPERARVEPLVELGINHEQQHQELILTDIKHALSGNPLGPAYGEGALERCLPAQPLGWIDHAGGLVEIGHDGAGFAFDNEGPRHAVHLIPFRLADRPVTCGEFLEFIEDGGYLRPEFWLSDGWDMVNAREWRAPLYWQPGDDGWRVFTLAGPRDLDNHEPLCHVSLYEADAYARWAGKRLPTEAEWEAVAGQHPVAGNFADSGRFHPGSGAPSKSPGFYGDVWEWTASPYTPFPGFRPAPGAVGEYNGKFMSSQMVLKGGSCASAPGHLRAAYRNFFPPDARWQFAGARLAEDA